jgi:anti-repressor protein
MLLSIKKWYNREGGMNMQEMANTEMTIFSDAEFGSIRVIEREGEPWFVAKDIAEMLGYADTEKMTRRLDDDEKTTIPFRGDGSNYQTNMVIINESGLYNAILGSSKPEAKRIKKWITSEVMPSIRKTGSYYAIPKTYGEALQLAATQTLKNEKLMIEIQEKEKEVKILEPKAEFYDTVADSTDVISMREVAAVLNIPGMGRNKLFEFLRKEKVLDYNNSPYRRGIESGYFRVIEGTYEVHGQPKISKTTYVYQRGVVYILKLLKKENMIPITLKAFKASSVSLPISE